MTDIVGSIRNFSRQGDQIKADVQLLQTHPQYETIRELAELQPSTFGLSIVFEMGIEKVGAANCARCLRLMSVDLVDTPAANPNGLFSTAGKSESFPAIVQRLRATGLSQGKAVEQAVCQFPLAHHAWLSAGGGASLEAVPDPNVGTFSDLVAIKMSAGVSKGESIAFVAQKFPSAHAAWLASGKTQSI